MELDLIIPENPELILEKRFVTIEDEQFKMVVEVEVEVEVDDRQGEEREVWKEGEEYEGSAKERREFEWGMVDGHLTGGNTESITEITDANPSFSGRLKVIFVNSFDQIGTTPKFLRIQKRIPHAISDARNSFNFNSNKDLDAKL